MVMSVPKKRPKLLLGNSKVNLKNRKIFALKMMGEHRLNSRFPLQRKEQSRRTMLFIFN